MSTQDRIPIHEEEFLFNTLEIAETLILTLKNISIGYNIPVSEKTNSDKQH